MKQNEHRLPLEGARNVRDLGGYPTQDGTVTRRGVFLRGDSTAGLTDGDVALLKEKGVTLVIDMRSGLETGKEPSRLRGEEGIRYENIVLFDGVQSSAFQGKLPEDMGGLYVHLLDTCRETYRGLFQLLARNQGASLFHCTAGKDRTGVVAMLLLQLAGVEDRIIVDDYAETERYMGPVLQKKLEWLRAEGIDVPEAVLRALPQSMEKTLGHLYQTYGGAYEYLRACEMTKEEINLLRKKLI